MTRHAHLDPSSFFLAGGATGVLLLHGFTGSPTEMRWIGDYLHARGMTVSGPLLPGHGTTVEAMNRCRWTDWTSYVEQALADLRARCQRVFVAGLSMGSLLTLYLTQQHPDLPGAIAYSPATWVREWQIYLTPIAKYFIAARPGASVSDLVDPKADLQIWSYEVYPVPAAAQLLGLQLHVRRRLAQVTCPLLLIYSSGDQAIHPLSASRTYERVGSRDKELVMLTRSGHNIAVDSQWRQVAEKTEAFIRAHGG